MNVWVTKQTVKGALPSIGCSAFVREFFTERELLILNKLNLMVGLTLSSSVRKLASELAISESTCKVILRKFRDSGLITAGNKSEFGTVIYLTPFGEILRGEINEKQ